MLFGQLVSVRRVHEHTYLCAHGGQPKIKIISYNFWYFIFCYNTEKSKRKRERVGGNGHPVEVSILSTVTCKPDAIRCTFRVPLVLLFPYLPHCVESRLWCSDVRGRCVVPCLQGKFSSHGGIPCLFSVSTALSD